MERAARALCSLDGKSENASVHGKPLWQGYLPEVRAVLLAIREPSEAMAEAGAEITSHISSTESEESLKREAADTWRVMIASALSDR